MHASGNGQVSQSASEREAAAQGQYGYSSWDRDIGSRIASHETQPIDEEALAYEARVRIAERATQDRTAEAYAALADELKTRTHAITQRVASEIARPWLDRALIAVVVAVLVWFLVMIVRDVWNQNWLGLVRSTIIMVLSWLAKAILWRPSHQDTPSTESPMRACLSRKCPDCGYDLSSTPDAISADLLDGQHVGPAMCSECQSKWPLVPARAELLA